MNAWRERISINPEICHGTPCISGTRVMVSVILDNLATGESHESIMEGYHVAREDIEAARHFADRSHDRKSPDFSDTAPFERSSS